MAGIKVPQYEIFKLGTKKLKYYKWDLTISEEDAKDHNEIIALFEPQYFRIIAKILDKPISEIDFKKYVLSVVVEHPGHFNRLVDSRGVIVNGVTFKRFLGTTSGLKCNTLLLVNQDILEELNRHFDCGRKEKALVPAKLEAYKALSCSASQPIRDPEGILVVSDTMVPVKDDVIYLDDSDEEAHQPDLKYITDYELTNNVTDGFNLCTIEYMKKVSEDLGLDYTTSGVCLRNAWLKGMLFPFPIIEFVEKFNKGNFIVHDIWGNEKDLRKVEMILTESSLKFWDCYDSIEDYIEKYHEHGYGFSVTKISPNHLDDVRELNYQYLQSYDFTDEDIETLCKPTVDYMKDAMCGDYKATLRFLGITKNLRNEDQNSWQHALKTSEYMIGDPIIIDSVHKMIKKKIDQAKIGRLLVEGNYETLSGDPFIMMQHICGLPETGLLLPDEIYSEYWMKKGVKEVVVFRSPMTSHNNIRKCKVVDDKDIAHWYRYYGTNIIINSHDTFCQAACGADFDSDNVFLTNNEILLKRHRKEPVIICIQKNADKMVPSEADMIKVEKNGMGNKVGSITNRATAMMEKISWFEPGTKEYEELHYRIMCGQLYQQNEIDKLKGIVSKPMPNSWYSYKGCNQDPFLKSICVENKPYFMIYIYSDYKRKYKKYMKESNLTAINCTRHSIDELEEKEKQGDVTDEEKELLENYRRWQPFGMGACAMNRICWHIEKEFEHVTSLTKKKHDFDYRTLRYYKRVEGKLLAELQEIAINYQEDYNNNCHSRKSADIDIDQKIDGYILKRHGIRSKYRELTKEACPDDKKRMDAIMTLAYTGKCNKQFYWDCVGGLVIQRLKEIEEAKNA